MVYIWAVCKIMTKHQPALETIFNYLKTTRVKDYDKVAFINDGANIFRVHTTSGYYKHTTTKQNKLHIKMLISKRCWPSFSRYTPQLTTHKIETNQTDNIKHHHRAKMSQSREPRRGSF